jgi:hypothetical protein
MGLLGKAPLQRRNIEAAFPPAMKAGSWKIPVLAALATYLVLAGMLAYTKRPWADEAWFANISVNILENGKTGISVLDPLGNANLLGRSLPGINEEYYLWIPVQEALYSLWYRMIGFSLLTMRAASICWGLVALGAWLVIVGRLTRNRQVASLALCFIATDFAFLDASADGRMDIMCAALSFSAIACYLGWRERHFGFAVLSSQILVVASGLTHPMGAVGFVALLFLIVYLDGRRIRWSHAALAFLAYLVGIAVAGAYILPNMPMFRAQFSGALTGRLGATESIGGTLLREITAKYRDLYLPPSAHGVSALRVLVPLIYAAGLAVVGLTPRLRGNVRYRQLLFLALVALVAISVLDSGKLYYYMVHSTPYLAAMTAVWAYEWWRQGTLLRVVGGSFVTALVVLQVGWVGVVIRKDSYHRSFLPMAAFVNGWTQKQGGKQVLIMTSAELAFVIGFSRTISDDALLGYQSRRQADLIVFDQRSYQSHLDGFERRRPDIAHYIRRLLAEQYVSVFSDGYYKVYERVSPISGGTPSQAAPPNRPLAFLSEVNRQGLSSC